MSSGPVFSYDEVKVAGGGAIKGKVTYNGTVPMRKVVPTKDTEVCGGVRDLPLIKVGKDRAVAEAVVYLKDVKKGKSWKKGGKYELDNKKCSFEPRVQAVPEGAKISVVNTDPVLHNTHSFLDNKTVFNVALPIKGMSLDKPMRKSGLVRVDCDVHGWMRAWIYVADNPYYAVTGADGMYSIDDIPQGDYTLVIWQEETGVMEKQVSIKAGKTITMDVELRK